MAPREKRELRKHEIGRDNAFFIHVSLLPFIGPSGELKTKPTQHSVAALRSIGIQPDAVVLRCDRAVPESIKRKISLMCDVDQEAIVAAVDAPSIYDIPKVLFSEGLDRYIVRRMSGPSTRTTCSQLSRSSRNTPRRCRRTIRESGSCRTRTVNSYPPRMKCCRGS